MERIKKKHAASSSTATTLKEEVCPVGRINQVLLNKAFIAVIPAIAGWI